MGPDCLKQSSPDAAFKRVPLDYLNWPRKFLGGLALKLNLKRKALAPDSGLRGA
jgi:hypothetical protein